MAKDFMHKCLEKGHDLELLYLLNNRSSPVSVLKYSQMPVIRNLSYSVNDRELPVLGLSLISLMGFLG